MIRCYRQLSSILFERRTKGLFIVTSLSTLVIGPFLTADKAWQVLLASGGGPRTPTPLGPLIHVQISCPGSFETE